MSAFIFSATTTNSKYMFAASSGFTQFNLQWDVEYPSMRLMSS